MSGFLGNWIKGLAAAAIFSSVMLTVTPKGSVKQVVKLVCGALLTFVLLSPLKSLNIDRLSEFIAQTKLQGQQIVASSENEADLIMKHIIEDETEAYILDKASKLGITDIKAEVTAKQGTKYPYPYSVSVSCNADESQRAGLSAYMEGELGIPKDRQTWSAKQDNASGGG